MIEEEPKTYATTAAQISENDRFTLDDLLSLAPDELLTYVRNLEDAVTVLWNSISSHYHDHSGPVVPIGGISDADRQLWDSLDEVDALIFSGEDEDGDDQ